MQRLMGPRSWLKPPSIAVCFTLYAGACGGRRERVFMQENQVRNFVQAKSKWHQSNVYTRWHLYQAVLREGGPWSLCLLHSETILSMRQGLNVILLVKFAVYFFFRSSVQDLKQTALPECFDRSRQFNPRVRQHNVGSESGRREVETLSQKVPHVFSTRSPTQSKWFYVV